MMEAQCRYCPGWYPLNSVGETSRHTRMRGTDLYVCRGSAQPPRSVRRVES